MSGLTCSDKRDKSGERSVADSDAISGAGVCGDLLGLLEILQGLRFRLGDVGCCTRIAVYSKRFEMSRVFVTNLRKTGGVGMSDDRGVIQGNEISFGASAGGA